MDMSKVIDRAQEKLGVSSDYELAKKLDMPKQRISAYRKGEEKPNAYACARLAEVLDVDPMALLAQVEADTEKNEARRNYWRALLKRIGAEVTASFFVVCVASLSENADATICKKSEAYCFQKCATIKQAPIVRSIGEHRKPVARDRPGAEAYRSFEPSSAARLTLTL